MLSKVRDPISHVYFSIECCDDGVKVPMPHQCCVASQFGSITGSVVQRLATRRLNQNTGLPRNSPQFISSAAAAAGKFTLYSVSPRSEAALADVPPSINTTSACHHLLKPILPAICSQLCLVCPHIRGTALQSLAAVRGNIVQTRW